MPIQPKIRAALGLDRYEDRGRPVAPLMQAPASSTPVMPVNQNGVPPAMDGLFGQMTQQANAASRSLPGFNYVPPQQGIAPVPAAAAGAPMPWTKDDRMAFLAGRQTPANSMAYTQALGQGAYDYNRQGRSGGGGGYTTSGRGGGRSSSWGGGQRGGGGRY